MSEANSTRIERRCKDALFHAIRGLNEINNQSQRLWNEFDTTDCEYHLNAAVGYLQQIREAIASTKGEKE